MKGYFHIHSNVRVRQKNAAKKTFIAIGCKRSGLIWGLTMVIALADKNNLGHGLVDGWTRWVACAYSGAAKRQTQNSKA